MASTRRVSRKPPTRDELITDVEDEPWLERQMCGPRWVAATMGPFFEVVSPIHDDDRRSPRGFLMLLCALRKVTGWDLDKEKIQAPCPEAFGDDFAYFIAVDNP